jgi:hypothetical protein
MLSRLSRGNLVNKHGLSLTIIRQAAVKDIAVPTSSGVEVED